MPGVGRTDRGAQRVTQSSVVLALQLLAVPILGAPVPDQDASAIEVRAIDALGEPTRRYRVSFRFRIVALTHVAAAQKTWAVGQVVGFTMYQGADWDSKARKDAIERLSSCFAQLETARPQTPDWKQRTRSARLGRFGSKCSSAYGHSRARMALPSRSTPRSRLDEAAQQAVPAAETPSPRLRLGVLALRRAAGVSKLIRVLDGY